MKWMHIASWVLVCVGALNWGLVGIGDYLSMNLNVVNLVFGFMPMLEWLVYLLVGLAAVYELATHKKNCKVCSGGGQAMM